MPYLKKVKDMDGAIAEAVASSIANLAQIPHPAIDENVDIAIIISKDESEVDKQIFVSLPTFKLEESLCERVVDLYFSFISSASSGLEGELLPLEFDDEFLFSLGETIAFNWFVGQGDLNATNVSIVGGKCYPYDFDYCFEDMHQSGSFVRENKLTYVHTSLNTANGSIEIIKTAVTNIITSLGFMNNEEIGIGPEIMLKNLNELDIQEKISKGFHSQLTKMDGIFPEDIVNKYVTNQQQKDICLTFLSKKQKEIENMIGKSMAMDDIPTPMNSTSSLDDDTPELIVTENIDELNANDESDLFDVQKRDKLTDVAVLTTAPCGQVSQIGLFGRARKNDEKLRQAIDQPNETPSNTNIVK